MSEMQSEAAFSALLDQLEAHANAPGAEDEWPAEQFQLLARAGVLGAAIPREYGGTGASAEEMTFGYIDLAAADLVTTFVLTQRNGACQRIAGSENLDLRSEILPRLSRGELFATVGVSHLTTSRQHLRRPAVEVDLSGETARFQGTVPWVTGAELADYVVTGGTCRDGRQVLAAIPMTVGGVKCLEPPHLMALNGSRTGSIELHDVRIPKRLLIAGPVEQVMKRGQGGGAGSLTTSALAVGTTKHALRRLQVEAENRPDLTEIHAALADDHAAVLAEIRSSVAGESARGASQPSSDTAGATSQAGRGRPATIESIRQRANSLALRSTQALLAACKGAGFVRGHPAERLVREAMFFLVWSCPQPVLTATLRELACVLED